MEVVDELDMMMFDSFDDCLSEKDFATFRSDLSKDTSSDGNDGDSGYDMHSKDNSSMNFATVFDLNENSVSSTTSTKASTEKRPTRSRAGNTSKPSVVNPTSSSRKRNLSVDNSAFSEKVMNIPTYTKTDLKAPGPWTKASTKTGLKNGISPEVSAVITSFSAKDEELLQTLLGNSSKLLSSDDDGDEFGDDDDLDNEHSFSSGIPG
jgi:hypothetical protein